MERESIITRNTSAWRFQTWAAFALSFGMTGIGILNLPVDKWTMGYLCMGLVFTVGSCFSLSKTIRDDAETDKTINRIKSAKTEKILRDYEE